MVFIHIDQKNCMNGGCDNVKKLDTYLGNKSCKTFLLIFMEGCGPCNATRPEWSKIENVLSPKMLEPDEKITLAVSYCATTSVTVSLPLIVTLLLII